MIRTKSWLRVGIVVPSILLLNDRAGFSCTLLEDCW
jgi:hypothetical protein